jgi:hypothetical protein
MSHRSFHLSRYLQLSFLIIALTSLNSTAAGKFEAGYVVKLTGDTLRGYVLIGDHVTNVKRCVYKESPTAPETTYGPGEIFAYGNLTERHYKSFSTSGGANVENFFIERVTPGKIALYFNGERYFIGHDGRTEELVEVEKEITRGGKTYLVKQPLYRSTLQNAMSDCPTIFSKVTSSKLSEKSLLGLLEEYNKCIGVSPPVVTLPRNVIAARVGLGAGVMMSSMTWASNGSVDYSFLDTSPRPGATIFTPSLWIELWRPAVRNRFRLRTGLNFYSGTYNLHKESYLTGLTYDFNLVMSRIEVPLHLKYSFSEKGLYIYGGIAVGKILTFDDKFTMSTYPGNSVIKETTSLEANNILTQFCVGLGYEIPIGRRGILLEADYRISSNITKDRAKSPSANLLGPTFTLGVPLTKERK